MLRKKIFLIKIFTFILLLTSNILAAELTVIPLKKPFLDKALKSEKISKSIIKPKPKPKKQEFKQIEKEIEIVKKDKTQDNFLLPKSKPLRVKKEKLKAKKKSKYFKQKDFNIAKKSIQAFEKSNWNNALKLSKKAKDKSIYNFVQWKHLLTSGNQASFYDYQLFIKKNENYPRINRIKYLAEHKLSTEKK